MSKNAQEAQTVLTTEEQDKLTAKLETKLKKQEGQAESQIVEKKSLRGTYELKVNYKVGDVNVKAHARHHTLSAKEIEEKIKERIVWRDGEGKRVIWRQTPFRYGYFHVYEETGKLVYKKITLDEVAELVKAITAHAEEPTAEAQSAEGEQSEEPSRDPFEGAPVVPLVVLNGGLYTVSEADKNTCQPNVTGEEGEQRIEQFEKTREVTITEDDLRPSVTYEAWIVERTKEIFAIDPADQQDLWLMCQDMIKRDAVAVVQIFVEKKGLTTYHLIIKPLYYTDKGQFMLLGVEVRQPFTLNWLMNVPVEALKQTAKRTRDLLAEVSGKKI